MPTHSYPPIAPDVAQKIANTIRFLSADGVQAANSGHPGLPMGCAEIATVLLTRFLRIDPKETTWWNRDRFILSAGHGSMLLYSMLALAGILSVDDLKQFRQLGSHTPGHPEFGDVPGVDFTAGPLGAGFAAAAGMALSERMLAEMYNTPKFDVMSHYTYVLMGDGCNMEGVALEAASLAGHLKLGKMIAFYDDNEISIEGNTSLAFTENVNARYEAMGWHVQDIDGHDMEAIANAILAAQGVEDKPSVIVAHTRIGRGAPNKEGKSSAHGEPLGEDELLAAKKNMGWSEEKFYVPSEVTKAMDGVRAQWAETRAKWDSDMESYEGSHKAIAKEFIRVMKGELPKSWKNATPEFAANEKIATRASGGKVMNAFGEILPELVGGAADLAPSTKTEIKTGKYPGFVGAGNYLGRNIHFGVREHAMGQMMNGMSAHGGFIPFSSTFFVFMDYMRPALRMAALAKFQQIFVMTHDSIFVGEDGPTHQPIEQIASIRCMPNVTLFRPCDANETAYAWQYAIAKQDGPTVLTLSRQNLPTLDRTQFAPAKDTLKGGYILELDPEGIAEIVLIASGSEVHLALTVAGILREAGRRVRVVSMPSLDLFKQQPEGYRRKVLPKRFKNRLVVEAGVRMGWEDILGDRGIFVGMEGFGASGPAEELAKKFGFTSEQILDKLAEADF